MMEGSTVHVGDTEYQIIADRLDVPLLSSSEEPIEGKWVSANLRVYLVKEGRELTWINLPSETMTSGRRLEVPQQLLKLSAPNDTERF